MALSANDSENNSFLPRERSRGDALNIQKVVKWFEVIL